MDYESTITSIIAASGKTGEEAEQLRANLEETAKAQSDLGYSADKSAAGLESLIKAGMSGEDSAKALRSALSLARLEGLQTSEAADLLVQTLTMFGKEAEDSACALDLISKAADAGIDTASGYATGLSNVGATAAGMGMGLDETLGALTILDNTFGDATKSGTFLNRMLLDVSKKADNLDISLYNADGSMKSLDEIVQQLKSNVQSFGGDQEQVNEYLGILDTRSAKAARALINYDGSIAGNVEKMSEQRSVQEKMNMVMDTTAGKLAETKAETSNASMEMGKMTSNLQLAWAEFSAGLGPVGSMANIMGPTMLQGAMGGVTMMLPTLIAKIAGAGGLTGALSSAVGGIGSFSGAMSLGVLGPIGLAVGAVAGLYLAWTNDWGGIRTFVTEKAIPAIQKGISGFIKGVRNSWNRFTGAISSAWETLWKGVQSFIEDPIGTVVSGVQGFAESILGIFGVELEGPVKDVWESLWNGVESFIKDPIGTVKNSVQGLAANIAGRFQEVYEETGDKWKATWEALKTIPGVGGILGAVEGIWESINDILRGWPGKALEWGRKMITGFIDGIKKAAEGISEAIGGAVGAIKDFLGFESPPKKGELRKVRDWGAGLIEEFNRGLGSAVPHLEDGIAGVVSGVIPGGITAAGRRSVSVVLNGPLVHVEGSADRKTLEEARRQWRRDLKNVIIEASSSNAPSTHKRIRTGDL